MAGDGDRPCRVGHVEDHPVAVGGLADALRGESDLDWVGAANTVEGILQAYPDVDVVVLDLRLPDGSSPRDNVERLHAAGVATLIYTSGEHPDLLRSAARADVLGVVMKDEPVSAVVAAIRAVARGQPVLPTEWAAAIDADPALSAVDLPPQLRKVLTLYAMGSSVPAIAKELHLASSTVTDYLGRIKRKYAEAGRPSPTKTHLVHRAYEDGLIEIDREQWRHG